MKKDTIRQTIFDLEKDYNDHNIRVVSARDIGSRMMNLDSDESDHDLLVLFSQPPEWYATLDGYKDSIDTQYHDGDVDIKGWNVKKFGELAVDSNPTVIEFLNSDLRYYEVPEVVTRLNQLQSMINENFVPISLYKHYISMATQNYEKYLVKHVHRVSGEESGTKLPIVSESKNSYRVRTDDGTRDIYKGNEDWETDTVEQTVKKNLFVLRSALYAEHVRQTHTVPEYDFPEFVENGLPGKATGKLQRHLQSLIGKKKAGNGDSIVGNPYNSPIRSLLNTHMEYQDLDREIDRAEIDSFIASVVG